MSARLGMRFGAALRPQFHAQPHLRFAQRRVQSTAAGDATATTQQSYFQRLWQSEVGPKTVHFWAPIMKVLPPLPPPLDLAMASNLVTPRRC